MTLEYIEVIVFVIAYFAFMIWLGRISEEYRKESELRLKLKNGSDLVNYKEEREKQPMESVEVKK